MESLISHLEISEFRGQVSEMSLFFFLSYNRCAKPGVMLLGAELRCLHAFGLLPIGAVSHGGHSAPGTRESHMRRRYSPSLKGVFKIVPRGRSRDRGHQIPASLETWVSRSRLFPTCGRAADSLGVKVRVFQFALSVRFPPLPVLVDLIARTNTRAHMHARTRMHTRRHTCDFKCVGHKRASKRQKYSDVL